MNFTTPRYALLFLNSKICIVHVINYEWSRSVNFSLPMFCMQCKHVFFQQKEPKPQLKQPCHRLLLSMLCILENKPKWLLVITFKRLQRVGLLRGREMIVYWCIPLFLPCFLFFFFFFYHFLSFFLSVLFTLSILLLSCHGLFPFESFLFLGPYLWMPPFLSASLRCLLFSYPRFFPFNPWLPFPFIVNRFNEISPFYP